MAGEQRFWWRSSAVLTAASLLGALGNYVFQALMGRLLPLAEFGYLNAALSLAAMLSLGMAAANQAVTHYLARHQAVDDQPRVAELKTASAAFLLRVTVVVSLLALVVLYPAARFFQVPRVTVAGLVLAMALAGIWGGLMNAWCAGLGQFTFLAGLGLANVAMRLLGVSIVAVWPRAESGIVASLLGSLLAVGLVLRRDGGQVRLSGSIQPVMEREFLLFLVAAFAVVGGQFLFLQSDLLIAQRHLDGPALGVYSAAGLFGRAVVYLASPVLVVWFTARSGRQRTDRTAQLLLLLYVGLLAVGAVAVIHSDAFLCRLLLGRVEEPVTALLPAFARAMFGIGLLQAAGAYALASRRLGLSLGYGVLAIIYSSVLMWYGGTATELVRLIQLGGCGAVTLLAGLALLTRSTRQLTATVKTGS